LTIWNNTEKTHTVMLERTSEPEQATTAAFVTTIPEFRSLFASEVLAPDTQVHAGTLCLMFTDLRGSTSMYEEIGDTSTYARVRQHFEILREVVGTHGGTFVKTVGDAVMAAFTDPSGAMGAAFEMHNRIRMENEQHTPALTLKIGLHQGPCFTVNMNETWTISAPPSTSRRGFRKKVREATSW
jgi:adenylate cyclase